MFPFRLLWISIMISLKARCLTYTASDTQHLLVQATEFTLGGVDKVKIIQNGFVNWIDQLIEKTL